MAGAAGAVLGGAAAACGAPRMQQAQLGGQGCRAAALTGQALDVVEVQKRVGWKEEGGSKRRGAARCLAALFPPGQAVSLPSQPGRPSPSPHSPVEPCPQLQPPTCVHQQHEEHGRRGDEHAAEARHGGDAAQQEDQDGQLERPYPPHVAAHTTRGGARAEGWGNEQRAVRRSTAAVGRRGGGGRRSAALLPLIDLPLPT